MPELPEVEVTRRGLLPHVRGRRVTGAIVRQWRLRDPVPDLPALLAGLTLRDISRRAKYLIWEFVDDAGAIRGYLVTHLGMSGFWRVWTGDVAPAGRHDHIDLVFGEVTLRLNDARRFGSVRWHREDPRLLAPLSQLGLEPWDEDLTDERFCALLHETSQPVKLALLSGSVVVGCGNIYCSESLFMAGIHPARAANRIGPARCAKLLAAIRTVLARAIELGGSTLRDFHGPNGQDGYFSLQASVYAREGQACPACGAPIRRITQSGRSTYYCPNCQK